MDYLHLDIKDCKLERLSLKKQLGKVLDFVLKQPVPCRSEQEDCGKRVAIVCNSAGDISVCVAVAIVLADECDVNKIDKQAVRRALALLSKV